MPVTGFDTKTWRQHGWLNQLHTALLLLFMASFLALLGWLLWGVWGLLLLMGLLILPLGIGISPTLVMRRFNAVPLSYEQIPPLFQMVEELSGRAGLIKAPDLYYVPSPIANAFTVGGSDRQAIGLTDGLLRGLGPRELAGVLAHEIAHVHSGDLSVMALADLMSQAIALCAQFGLLLALISIPLMILGDAEINPLLILLLIFAPYPAAFAQLALSRIREYDADRFAISLTGDPEGLSHALQKLEEEREGWLARLLLPGYRRGPALLRSHPSSALRIERLRQFKKAPGTSAEYPSDRGAFAVHLGDWHVPSRSTRKFGKFFF